MITKRENSLLLHLKEKRQNNILLVPEIIIRQIKVVFVHFKETREKELILVSTSS